MNAEFNAVVAEMQPELANHSGAVQEKAIALAIEMAFKGVAAKVATTPGAAGDFWTIFLELFKMLLPLILKLLTGI